MMSNDDQILQTFTDLHNDKDNLVNNHYENILTYS